MVVEPIEIGPLSQLRNVFERQLGKVLDSRLDDLLFFFAHNPLPQGSNLALRRDYENSPTGWLVSVISDWSPDETTFGASQAWMQWEVLYWRRLRERVGLIDPPRPE